MAETAWRSAGRVAMVGFNRSHAPLTEAVLRRMGDSIKLVQIRVNAGQLPDDHWLHDLESGGGRLLGEGCHFVDLALRLLREGTEAMELTAENGQYEFPLEGRNVLLVRIEVETAQELVAEISANKHLIAVRFRKLDERLKLQAINEDINFKLSLCNF